MSKFKNNIFSRSALDLDDAAQKAVKALKWWFKYKRIWLLFFLWITPLIIFEINNITPYICIIIIHVIQHLQFLSFIFNPVTSSNTSKV